MMKTSIKLSPRPSILPIHNSHKLKREESIDGPRAFSNDEYKLKTCHLDDGVKEYRITVNDIPRSILDSEFKKKLREKCTSPIVNVSAVTNNIFSPRTEKINKKMLKSIKVNLPKKIDLIHYKPRDAPYVPNIIVSIIKKIQLICSKKPDWMRHFRTANSLLIRSQAFDQNAKKVLSVLLRQDKNDQAANDAMVKDYHCPELFIMMHEFLSRIKPKILQLNRDCIAQLCQKPFYDRFLCVNPGLKGILRRAIMRMPRTSQDTLAFIMLHIIHMWETTPQPAQSKTLFAKFYGPLLVAYSEKVTLHGELSVSIENSEAVIVGVLLELFDKQFWHSLSYYKTETPITYDFNDTKQQCLGQMSKTSSLYDLSTTASSFDVRFDYHD